MIIPESDCVILESAWSGVMTVPNLPLQHGDNAALTCLAGHLIVKKGGIKAICLYGQVLTTNKPLECLSIGRLFD